MKLDSTFVVLQPDQSAVPIAVTPAIYEELDRRFEGFKGRVLVSCQRFDSDWDTDVPTAMLFITPGEGTQHKALA